MMTVPTASNSIGIGHGAVLSSSRLAMEIVILGFNGCLGTAFVGSVDMLKLSSLMISKASKRQPFGILTASSNGKPFEDSSGRNLNTERSITAITAPSAIMIPGYLSEDNTKFLSTKEIAILAAWLRRQHALGALVCASCSGVFLLGEAGLLDGRRCTTTWWRHDELKARYPRADAIWGAPLIEDQRIVTSGGPLSWIDLCLHVIRSLCGHEAAKTAADFAVVDTAPSTRSVYVPLSHLSAANPFLLEAEHMVRIAGEDPVTAQDLARALRTSDRTLNRRLKEATGETPKQFIDRVRFETARMLLETTNCSMKQLAANSGYSDAASFRRAFYRYSGMTPAAYRTLNRNRQT
jgi:transcriptional regulator GlxA family with amidase domain